MEEEDVTEEDEDDEDGIRFVTLESRFENKETVLRANFPGDQVKSEKCGTCLENKLPYGASINVMNFFLLKSLILFKKIFKNCYERPPP